MADTLIAGTTLVEKESRSIGDVPIGGIVAWAKSLSGVPSLAEGWVECDGSVLVDAQSSLNGQTIPDLNGGEFLRGASTSGGTGGSDTSTSTLATFGSTGSRTTGAKVGYIGDPAAVGMIDDGGGGASTFVQTRPQSSAFSIIPKNYEVVWIMRVR